MAVEYHARMLKTIAMLAVLAACSKGYDKDWSGKKLVPTDDTVDGIKYSISIPEGLPKSDATYIHGWDDVKPEGDTIPKVFTGTTPLAPASIDDAIGSAVLD